MLEWIMREGSGVLLGKSRPALEELIDMASKSGLGRSRYLLHRSHEDKPQVMLIYLERGSDVGVHRHPLDKSEIYIVLEGTLEVSFRERNDSENLRRMLAPWGNESGLPTVSLHRDSLWHEPRAVSDYVLYLEVYSGPFSKDLDVEYL